MRFKEQTVVVRARLAQLTASDVAEAEFILDKRGAETGRDFERGIEVY